MKNPNKNSGITQPVSETSNNSVSPPDDNLVEAEEIDVSKMPLAEYEAYKASWLSRNEVSCELFANLLRWYLTSGVTGTDAHPEGFDAEGLRKITWATLSNLGGGAPKSVVRQALRQLEDNGLVEKISGVFAPGGPGEIWLRVDLVRCREIAEDKLAHEMSKASELGTDGNRNEIVWLQGLVALLQRVTGPDSCSSNQDGAEPEDDRSHATGNAG